MQWWLGHTRPVRVLLIAAVASGCATPVALWRPVPPPEPSIVQTGSDRLRDRSAQPPPSEIPRPSRASRENANEHPCPTGYERAAAATTACAAFGSTAALASGRT